MDKSPHPLMHLGMTGWIHIKSDPKGHYRSETNAPEEWPPRFTKFIADFANDSMAFVDPRRLARIRLIDSPDGELRKLPPLVENGPDPVIEPPTLEQVTKILAARKVPVKALLLDQSTFAGIGNWVADEILFQARLHPEIYTNTMTEGQVSRLHEKILEVTKIAVETDADSDKFPKDWLMKHRWGKGKKADNRLPTGEKVEFLKVGGRTSAYVPTLQKKTEKGLEAEDSQDVKEPIKKGRGRKVKMEEDEQNEEIAKDDVEDETMVPEINPKKGWGVVKDIKKAIKKAIKDEDEDKKLSAPSKRKRAASNTVEKEANEEPKRSRKDDTPGSTDDQGRRRSTRKKN